MCFHTEKIHKNPELDKNKLTIRYIVRKYQKSKTERLLLKLSESNENQFMHKGLRIIGLHFSVATLEA